MRDHAGGFPVAGQHDFRGGRAARRGDHGVESAPAVRRGGGFAAPAVRAGTGGGGENRAPAPVGGRATVAAQHAGGRFPGGGRLAGERGPKPDGGDGQGGGGGRAARLEELAEVDGQQGVVNRGGPPPGVQARAARRGRPVGC